MKFIFAISMLLIVGCAHAKLMKETKDGGRIIVYGSREMGGNGAKENAKKMMLAKCSSGYEIVETGQTPIGNYSMAGYNLVDNELYYDFKCN